MIEWNDWLAKKHLDGILGRLVHDIERKSTSDAIDVHVQLDLKII